MSLKSNILWIQSSLKRNTTKTAQYDKIFLALWHMKFQEHLTFIFQNLYLWDGYNFCHPSLWRNEVTLGKWKLWTLFDKHIHCFFLCAEIYAASHIIILFKAFLTRLPYQDIENRTYLNVLYEYLSANLPYNNLGKKIRHLRMRREPTFAEQISFRQTSLVSSNESRFFKRVSFRQMSLVSSNESRCVKRVSFRQTSLALTRFDSLEQTSLVENRLSSDS